MFSWNSFVIYKSVVQCWFWYSLYHYIKRLQYLDVNEVFEMPQT